MTIAIANVSPQGTSTFKSLKVSAPTGIKFKSISPIASPFTATVAVDPVNGAFITVDSILPPVKPFDPVVGTIYISFKVDVACTFAGGNFTANVYTGSGFTGQQFDLSTPSNPTLNVGSPCTATLNGTANPSAGGQISCTNGFYGSTNASCTATVNNYWRFTGFTGDCLSSSGLVCTVSNSTNPMTSNKSVVANFAANALTVTPPSTAYVGTAFSVPVTYNGPNPASVSLAWNCTPSASGSQTVPAPSSSPVNFSVTLNKAGSCTFTASTPSDYPSATATTAVNVYTGSLGCTYPSDKGGDLNPAELKTYVKETDQGKWGLLRGNNKPLSDACAPVDYTFELDVMSTPQTSKFIVPDPTVSHQGIAAKYVVVWGRFDVIDDGANIWASKRPKMSWGIPNPVAGTDDFVPALPCVLDPDNPDLAGTYANGFTSVPTGDLDKLLPTIPAVLPFTNFNANYYPQYMVGKKAKMCVAQHGWTAVGTDASNPLDTSTYPVMVQMWTSVIDQADGFMNLE
jgi:hypothetical protein